MRKTGRTRRERRRTRSSCTTPTACSSTSPSRWRQEQGLTRRRGRVTSRRWRRRKDKAREGGKKFAVTAVQGRRCRRPTTRRSTQSEVDRREGPRLGEGQRGRHAAASSRPAKRSRCLLDRTNFYAEQGGQVGDTGIDPLDDGSGLRGRGHAAARRHGAARRHAARRRARRSARRSR